MPEQLTQYQQLANYIKTNISKGYTIDSLRYSLMSQGYSRTSVDMAIKLANKQLANSAPKMQEKPQITYKIIDDNLRQKVLMQEKKGFFKNLFS